MWFTETPWPPIFLLGIVACVLLALWYSQKRAVWLFGVIVVVASCVAIYFIEQAIVTDAERVEENVRQLVAAFQRKDRQATLSHFSVGARELRIAVDRALDLVDITRVSVKDVDVRLVAQGSQALSHFRANGTGTLAGLGGSTEFASRWELTWQKEGDVWKIVEVRRLNPIKEEEMSMFDPRVQ
jgi:ketosteroid isomerase-like protein